MKMTETELLERAVGKLSVMSELAVATKAGISDEQLKNMNSDDRAMMEYMQGAAAKTPSNRKTHLTASMERTDSRKSVDHTTEEDRVIELQKEKDLAVSRTMTGDPKFPTIAEVGLAEALIDSWNFNVLDVSQDQLTTAVLYMVCDSSQQCR